MSHPSEPTSEECNAGTRLLDFDGRPAFACWYPQMGGYFGTAVVLALTCDATNPPGGCFDVYVWHDGTFPFNDDYGLCNPAHLHHCSADQFIEFGNAVKRMQELAK